MTKIELQKQSLLSALSTVAGVAEPKSTMPILSMVLLTPGNGSLRVAASRLSLTATVTLSAPTAKQGTGFAVNARDLLERVKAMPDGAINLEVDGGNLRLTSKGSKRKFSVYCISGDEFPKLPDSSDAKTITTISGEKLTSLLGAIRHSLNAADERVYVHSAKLEWEPGRLSAISSDGHRLTVERRDHECTETGESMIHAESIAAVMKLEKAGNVDVRSNGSWMHFVADGTEITVQVTAGNYVPYQQLILDRSETPVHVEAARFADAVHSVALAANRESGGVELSFNGSIQVSARSATGGDSEDEVAAEYSGSKVHTAAAARYLEEAIRACGADQLAISLSGPLDPIRIESFEPQEGREHIGMVMPQRI